MAFTPSPSIPPRGARGVFSNAVDAFIRWLSTLPAQLDAFLARLETIAAGGAYAVPFKYAVAQQPGRGGFLSWPSATTMYFDKTDARGANVTDMLRARVASTNGVKATLRFSPINDPARWFVVDVLSYTQGVTYDTVDVRLVAQGGGAINDNEDVMLFFDRTGDKGDKGDKGDAGTPGGYTLLASYSVTAAVASIDFLSLFTDAYNKYIIEVEGMVPTAAASLALQPATGGALDTGLNCSNMTSDGVASTASPAFAQIAESVSANDPRGGVSGTFEVRNARAAAKGKAIGFRGRVGGVTAFREGSYDAANQMSGFRLFFTGSTFAKGAIKIYGVKAS